MSELSVLYILDKLLLEQDFSKKLEVSIENIMKDGKIDQYDIPEIIYIISELITRTPNLNLTPENLSEVIKKLVDLICKNENAPLAIEIKSGKSSDNSLFKGLKYWQKLQPESQAILLYGGKKSEMISDNLSLTSWMEVAAL